MNCIIIDDDKVSRILFEKYISKTDFLTLKSTFGSAIEALGTLHKDEKIDLIFLDIEMPEMSGLELIKNFDDLPMVIIISAKERYAIEAIEFNIVDYLLKPVSYARFLKAVNKAYNRYKETLESPIHDDGIFIKNAANSFIRLRYEDILFIEALENYVVLNTFDEKYTIHFTMKSLINKLPLKLFIRIHRSFIVNVHKISCIEDNTVIIKTKTGEKTIPIAKTFKSDLLDVINIVTK